MDNKECKQNYDIISILEEKVQKLSKENWEKDDCPPEFLISLNNEDMCNQEILITINHMGMKFTERIFPRKNAKYGYESILDQMINLYNRTM